ncbi:MAG: chlorophyll synthase ChlG [Gemmatimonadales bacterium]|nr:MAG: chlorophyll synthase ChlG [Gemmatimonadales bacterium]
MTNQSVSQRLHPESRALPQPGAVLELFKPITWFPPMWAFLCGAVSSGVSPGERWPIVLLGVAVAGPLVCATSQAVNDWFDRRVDAINEPERPIPSGRIPGRWGLYLAIVWTVVSAGAGWFLGIWGFTATLVALAFAWAYSAPPFRLKQNGWYGNLAVGISYEGIAWFTGAAVLLGGVLPGWPIIVVALLYSLGAHGIMTLNDYKAIEGDRQMGIRSLPAALGPQRAAQVASAVMVLAQIAVIALLVFWGLPGYATGVGLLLAVQIPMLARFLAAPTERALWYSALGVPLFVSGMMVTAFGLRAGGL